MSSSRVAFLIALMLAAPAAAQRPDNYYSTGNHVEITTAMPADVVVAGRTIDIQQPVAGDILAAGWSVTLSGRADDDVRIAGGQVSVNAPIQGDLTLAGRDVTVGAGTQVAGRSWITGQNVRVDGAFEREIQIAGADVRIAGELKKPVTVVSDHLEILPGARILAPLTYKGTNEMHVANGAVVNGPVTFERITPSDARRARSFPVASSMLFILHLFIAGVLVLLFAPKAEQSVVDEMRAHPWKSLLLGFVLLVTTPVAAVLLVVSVLGLPLGVALAGVYAVAIFLGLLGTAFCIGELEARWLEAGRVRTGGQNALFLLAGVLTLAVLRSMLGGVVVFASVLFGLGAMTLWLRDQYEHRSAVTHA